MGEYIFSEKFWSWIFCAQQMQWAPRRNDDKAIKFIQHKTGDNLLLILLIAMQCIGYVTLLTRGPHQPPWIKNRYVTNMFRWERIRYLFSKVCRCSPIDHCGVGRPKKHLSFIFPPPKWKMDTTWLKNDKKSFSIIDP